MMRLKMKLIKELAEEIARREAETALEVGEEDDPLAYQWRRGNLSGRRCPTLNAIGDPASSPEPLDLAVADVGALPRSAGGFHLPFVGSRRGRCSCRGRQRSGGAELNGGGDELDGETERRLVGDVLRGDAGARVLVEGELCGHRQWRRSGAAATESIRR